MKHYRKVLLLLLCILLVWLFLFCRSSDKHVSQEEQEEDVEVIYCCVLESGENVDYILQQMEIEGGERFKITESLNEHLDMKTCMPGDSVIVVKDQKGTFMKLEYVKGPLLRFVVSRKDTQYTAERIEVPPSLAFYTIKGTVESSLYESLVDLGESPELVFDYADIFAWVIDFLTEVQNGDTFEIIVEKQFLKDRHIGDGRIIAATYKGEIGNYFAFFYIDPDGREDYYDEEGNSLRKQLLKTPLSYRRISSYFSLKRMHPILKIRRPHYGVDFAAPIGTPVCTVGDGHVAFAGWKGGYGKLVVITHPNSFKTYYGHLSKIKKGIVAGAKVVQGEVIGNVGSTGLSTGPHLHFGIKKYGKWVDPLKIDLPPADPINEEFRDLYMVEMEKLKNALRYICVKDSNRVSVEGGGDT
jgi:murein DD-endopeptidase MepM/ murein hydrolase activator NlpD